MAKSTAQAEAQARDLKNRLEFRGFSVAESKNAQGWPRLVINATDASVEIVGRDAVSKDIFGNALTSFTPHDMQLASIDGQSKPDLAQILTETQKTGIEKVTLKTGVDLATAEGTAGTEIIFDIRWPTKGL